MATPSWKPPGYLRRVTSALNGSLSVPLRWLRSVLCRESGATNEAWTQLDLAWATFPHNGFHDGELQQCLFEGATRCVDDDLQWALLLSSHAVHLRNVTVLSWGIEYNVDAMLDRLRFGLADDRVREAMEDLDHRPRPVSLRPDPTG